MYFAGGAPPDLLAPLQIGWPCRKSGEEHLGRAHLTPVLHAGASSPFLERSCKFGSKSAHRAMTKEEPTKRREF